MIWYKELHIENFQRSVWTRTSVYLYTGITALSINLQIKLPNNTKFSISIFVFVFRLIIPSAPSVENLRKYFLSSVHNSYQRLIGDVAAFNTILSYCILFNLIKVTTTKTFGTNYVWMMISNNVFWEIDAYRLFFVHFDRMLYSRALCVFCKHVKVCKIRNAF